MEFGAVFSRGKKPEERGDLRVARANQQQPAAALHHPAGQGRMEGLYPGAVDHHRPAATAATDLPANLDQLGQRLFCLGGEARLLFGENVHGLQQGPAHRRIELSFEHRNELVAHPVAQKTLVVVGAVHHPVKALVTEITKECCLVLPKQGADQATLTPGHPRQPFYSGTADQPDKELLNLVVSGVAEGDRFRPVLLPQSLQGGVTQLSGCGLGGISGGISGIDTFRQVGYAEG